GVAAVDDHVAWLEQRGELVDDRVGGGAGVDHDDQAARALQGLHELPGGLRRDEVPLVAELVDHGRHAGDGPVVQGDRVAVPGEVAGQVAAHHAQAGHADLRRCLRHVLRFSLYSSALPFSGNGHYATVWFGRALQPAAGAGASTVLKGRALVPVDVASRRAER